MSRGSWLLPSLGGLFVSAIGTAVSPFGWTLVPGMIFSWTVFPHGIRPGAASPSASFVVIFLASSLAWAVVLFGLLQAWRRLRPRGGKDAAG